MTHETDDARFHDWVAQQVPGPAPSTLLARVLAELDRDPRQQSVWGLGPRPLGWARALAGAAVVALIALLAFSFLPQQPPGEPNGSASPSATSAPEPSRASASATASSEPSSTASPTATPSPWVAVARFGAPNTYTAVNDITAGGPGFVAVGETWQTGMVPGVNQIQVPHSGHVWTSADGRSWEPIADATPFEGAVLQHVVATGDGLVAYGIEHTAGGSGYVMHQWVSADGLVWRRGPDPTLGPDYVLTDVIPGGHGFVAVGCCGGTGGARIWTSSDGLQWTMVFELDEALRAGLVAIARGPNGYSAIGYHVLSGGGVVPLAVTSADGAAWDAAPYQSELASSDPTDLAWLDSKYLATGLWSRSGLAVWQSSDGRIWQPVSQPPTTEDATFGSGQALSVAAGRAYLSAWIVGSPRPAGIWTSTDGDIWSQVESEDIPDDAAMSEVIETANGALIMVGQVGYHDAQGVIWLLQP